ncbi:carbonic anhydrase [Gymnopus androsaceus JB14]|uniref:Carbonic anhydrase n=1 Tax=Gymnopus androsaceus JB14 TaxID=1447944 RepID=A0A6A4HJ60_9AGAR|nr:carbonic anhydrase [Gymnopus androsaceus JB14]
MIDDGLLRELLSRNARWAQSANIANFTQSDRPGEPPRILWIGCADSRVPESVITSSNPGEIFVHRNIANQVHLNDTNLLSLVQFAVNNLHVEHVIVVGHEDCGGVQACLPGQPPPDPPLGLHLEEWLKPLTLYAKVLPALQPPVGGNPLEILIRENVKLQVTNLSNMIQTLTLEGPHVHGWIYDVRNGRLRDVNDEDK